MPWQTWIKSFRARPESEHISMSQSYRSMPDEKRVQSVPSSQLLLHVLTERESVPGRDMLAVARAALDGGATVIQLHEKRASTRTLIEQGQALRVLTRERGALLIVNDRVDIALATHADGLYIGRDDMPAALARRLLGPRRLLGVSVASLYEAEEAVAAGADYLSVGPIFATPAQASSDAPVGLQLLRELARLFARPLIATGGITMGNAVEIVRAGACGLAISSAVVQAEDITTTTRQFRSLFP
jgi:thiamine-phosphate pyrophosphorylase